MRLRGLRFPLGRRRLFRGQAEVVGALLVIVALMMLFAYMVLSYLSLVAVHEQSVRQQESFEELRKQEYIVFNASNNCIVNAGSVALKIIRLWLKNGTIVPLNVYLEPHESWCSPILSNAVKVVTERANVFELVPRVQVEETANVTGVAKYAEVAGSVAIRQVQLLSSIETVVDLANTSSSEVQLDPRLVALPTPDNIIAGNTSGVIAYDSGGVYYPTLLLYCSNVNVTGTLSYGNFYAGYTPGTSDKYNLLIMLPEDHTEEYTDFSFEIVLGMNSRCVDYAHDIVRIGTGVRAFILTDDWVKPGFNDTGWYNLSYTQLPVGTHGVYRLNFSDIWVRAYYVLENVTASKTYLLNLTTDDGFELWVDGEKVSIADELAKYAGRWSIDITSYLKNGTNVIAIHVHNYYTPDCELNFVLSDNGTIVYPYEIKYIYVPYWWVEPGFQDTSWEMVSLPIGNHDARTLINFHDVLLRKTFELPEGEILEAYLYIAGDDGAEVWVNGVRVLNSLTDRHGASYWNYKVDVTSALRSGVNVVAVMVHDFGGDSYVDMLVYVKIKVGDQVWVYYIASADTYGSKEFTVRRSDEPLDSVKYRIKLIGFKPHPYGFSMKFATANSIYCIGSECYVIDASVDSYDNVSNVLGYWWFYAHWVTEHSLESIDGDTMFLNGTVDQMRVYGFLPSSWFIEPPRGGSYEPYLLIADYDGNGLPEIVFTTEDYTFGPCIEGICYNDDGSLLDYSDSDTPFLLYLVGDRYVVDPSKYGLVVVNARIYYHDTEGGDTDCVNEPYKFLLAVYLVDPGPDNKLGTDDDRIVSSNEFIYQQLDDWEDTYPPNKNFITVSIPLAVPEPSRPDAKYYLALGFIDPYNSFGSDDVDFTIAIELIGLTYYARS